MTCRVSFSFCLSILSAVHWSTDFSKLLSTLTQPCRSWWSFHSRSLHRPLWWVEFWSPTNLHVTVLEHAWLVGHCVWSSWRCLLQSQNSFRLHHFLQSVVPPKKAGLCEAHWSRTSLCWNRLGTGPISTSSNEHCSGYAGKAMHPLMWAPTSFWCCSLETNEWTMHCTMELWYQHIIAYRTTLSVRPKPTTFEN